MERKFTKEVLTDVAVAALTVCGFGLALAATIRLMFMIIGVYQMNTTEQEAYTTMLQWEKDAAIESLRESGKKDKPATRPKLEPEMLKLVDAETLEKLKQMAIEYYNEMEQLIMAINDIQDELKEKSKS